MSFRGVTIPAGNFRFAADKPSARHAERFRGLQVFGPYAHPAGITTPKLGFVFPSEFRDDANRLYLALRNGVGYFRGLSNTFQLNLGKDQVFPITGFSLGKARTPEEQANLYTEAILSWRAKQSSSPDLLVVVHPKTPPWQDRTPYYTSKAALLAAGFLSQDVTVELIRNANQFQWSVANIALAIFTKLGGTPWIVERRLASPQVVLGVGQAHVFDPKSRKLNRQYAFTTCIRAEGPFEFSVISEPATTRQEYLAALRTTITSAVDRVRSLKTPAERIAIHLPKRFGREEREVVSAAALPDPSKPPIQIDVLQVTPEEDFFALDTASSNGLPPRGICVALDNSTMLLYTEGRDELQPWQNRLPTALRVRYFGNSNQQVLYDLLSQILDLSQVNYRGFNAASSPVSLVYSSLVAKLLSHLPAAWIDRLSAEDKHRLETRMWFL